MRPLFTPGQIVATPEAIDALKDAEASATEFLMRHLSGDWGEMDAEDKRANNDALRLGNRLMSAYKLPTTGVMIWIITEWDRSVTTILLPENY